MTNPPIPFEPRRFRSAARHYLRGRPAYAARLFERVAAVCGLESRHAILDLGCGPGQIACGLAPFADSVTAIDPEPTMLEIAERAAREAGFSMRFINGSSYDIGPELGHFRVAAIGRAFHWMDRGDTLARLDRMLDPKGAVVLFSDRHPAVPDNAWRKAYDAVLDRYSAGDTARSQRKADGWARHESVLLDSPFSELERIGVIERRTTPVEHMADRMLSLSSVSRDHIGALADAIADELRTALAPYTADGNIREVVESQALIAKRPAECR